MLQNIILFAVNHANLKVLVELLQDISSKQDIILINQQRLISSLMPEEEAVVRPKGLPPLPLQNEDAFKAFETFLEEELHFTTAVRFFFQER